MCLKRQFLACSGCKQIWNGTYNFVGKVGDLNDCWFYVSIEALCLFVCGKHYLFYQHLNYECYILIFYCPLQQLIVLSLATSINEYFLRPNGSAVLVLLSGHEFDSHYWKCLFADEHECVWVFFDIKLFLCIKITTNLTLSIVLIIL